MFQVHFLLPWKHFSHLFSLYDYSHQFSVPALITSHLSHYYRGPLRKDCLLLCEHVSLLPSQIVPLTQMKLTATLPTSQAPQQLEMESVTKIFSQQYLTAVGKVIMAGSNQIVPDYINLRVLIQGVNSTACFICMFRSLFRLNS